MGTVRKLGTREVVTLGTFELGVGSTSITGDLRDGRQLDHFDFGVHGAEVPQGYAIGFSS